MSTALKTDHYELTMLQAALKNGTAHRKAVFELFARKLPQNRGYGVVAGTERALKGVKNFRFTKKQLKHLTDNQVVNEETINYLRNYKFRGTIIGYREGDLFFPYSPILTVKGTFADTVILETLLLSIFNYDSAVASAASRMVQTAGDTKLIEMGSRRAHDTAAVDAARAAYIAGFGASSNLEAGYQYGVPTSGTAAHAFTLAHDTEEEAFTAQVESLGKSTTLLVDTYNIENGIRTAVQVAGTGLGAIRIDSGDPVEEAVKARKLLNDLGAVNTKIVLSSDIDEYIINNLKTQGAPVDVVGAGTRVVTGSGHPTAGMVYKLVEIEDNHGNMVPVAKKAEGKISVGSEKRVYRRTHNTQIVEEIIVPGDTAKYDRDETYIPVTTTLMVNGKRKHKPSLESVRAYHAQIMSTLPPAYKTIFCTKPALTVYATETAQEKEVTK